MKRDIRQSAEYREAEAIYRLIRQPGTGQITDPRELSASHDGLSVVFCGVIPECLEGPAKTRICLTELKTADTRVLTFGPNSDRLPKFSPDGQLIAFLSDRHRDGDFQLYILDRATGAARATPAVEGWVEYLQWSPDGTRILLGVAGHGADISGGQGAVASKQNAAQVIPSWMPAVEAGDEDYRWRRVWIYELNTNQVHPAGSADRNIWEASWCGNDKLAVISSPGPLEGLWYSATLQIVDIASGTSRDMYTPKDQLGWLAASHSGKQLAVVEALCSDRWFVAGDLRLVDTISGHLHQVNTEGVDITYTEWRSERTLLAAGHRGFETVVGTYDVTTRTFTEVWSSADVSTCGFYAHVTGLKDSGDCALLGEGFTRAPEIALIREGHYQTVRSFGLVRPDHFEAVAAAERVTWQASDGLDIQGWLLLPPSSRPHPLIMYVHGGPIWQWHPVWLGRSGATVLMLLKRGFGVFLPNPRGSSGRGQDFAHRVLGDMGGADTYDYLSGLDHLVAQGIADPKALGVTGGSYGGFMTSWLITQDSRFAAAVSVVPVTNQVTEHLLSNIPHFVSLFLADDYRNPTGQYFQRSPIMHAHKVRTPTLNICGALDRVTPPEEAVQFHNALRQNGVPSVLVTYPEEGHGVKSLPAGVDYAARVVMWFEEHMGAARNGP